MGLLHIPGTSGNRAITSAIGGIPAHGFLMGVFTPGRVTDTATATATVTGATELTTGAS